MTPRKDGVLVATGKFNTAEDLEGFRETVIQAAANVIAAIENCLAEGEHIAQILSLYVFVNASSSFTLHPKVGDIVSDYICGRYGDAGKSIRVAVGMASLPGDAPVEVQAIAAVE